MPDTLEDRLKELIVDALGLEDVTPAEIETDAPLFGEGLGLDSIDALELAMAIHSEFGVRTEQNDERNREYYHSVRSLSEFVRRKQAEPSSPAESASPAPSSSQAQSASQAQSSPAEESSPAES